MENFYLMNKPVDEGGAITYKFVPGPFMRRLIKAKIKKLQKVK